MNYVNFRTNSLVSLVASVVEFESSLESLNHCSMTRSCEYVMQLVEELSSYTYNHSAHVQWTVKLYMLLRARKPARVDVLVTPGVFQDTVAHTVSK